MSNSPFNWRSQESVLATDKDFNGVNRNKSLTAQRMRLLSDVSGPMTSPHNQTNVRAYGSAKSQVKPKAKL